MHSIIIAALLVAAASGGTLPLCGNNEEYATCGTACPKTCDLSHQVKVCPDICVQGCFCQEGFVRTTNGGACVAVSSCPVPEPLEPKEPLCDVNEEFAECGSMCPQICGETAVRACPDVCLTGCVCQPGFIRSARGGLCISETQCKEAQLF